jgi:hypothetical protein
MTAESPLNAPELAEESSAGPVNPASSPMSALVRDEITLARMELAQLRSRRPMPRPRSRP